MRIRGVFFGVYDSLELPREITIIPQKDRINPGAGKDGQIYLHPFPGRQDPLFHSKGTDGEGDENMCRE